MSYRSDTVALEARREALVKEVQDIDRQLQPGPTRWQRLRARVGLWLARPWLAIFGRRRKCELDVNEAVTSYLESACKQLESDRARIVALEDQYHLSVDGNEVMRTNDIQVCDGAFAWKAEVNDRLFGIRQPRPAKKEQ